MTTNGLLFVDKSPTSQDLTRSTGSEHTEIQRHVQTGLRRPRKVKRNVRKINPPLANPELVNSTTRTLSYSTDPFLTGSVPMDGTTCRLLHYYVSWYRPTVWTYFPASLGIGPRASENDAAFIRTAKAAVSDSLLMYCLLSATASRMNNVDALYEPQASTKLVYFTQQALRQMQQRVGEPQAYSTSTASEELVRCIVFLGSAEAYCGNYAVSMMHLKAGLQILEPNGGVMQLQNPDLQRKLLILDLFLASAQLEPCICECRYDPGPAATLELTSEEMHPFKQHGLASELLACDSILLPPTLRRIVYEMLELYTVSQSLNVTVRNEVRALEITSWVRRRNMAIANRLLGLKCAEQRVHGLRIGLKLWTLLALNTTGRIKIAEVMASKLRSVLAGIPKSHWCGYDEVQLWLLLMGYSCADEHSNDLDWFGEEIAMLSYNFAVEVHTGGLLLMLESFQMGFFYHAPSQRTRIERLAKSLD